MTHKFYSQRTGSNPNMDGLSLEDSVDLFTRVYKQLETDGYFDEAFGFFCVDEGHVEGSINDIELEIFLTIRKKNLWPISKYGQGYTEDDF